MITEVIRELLSDILIETKPHNIVLSLDPVSQSATITVVAIHDVDFAELREMVEDMAGEADAKL